MPISTWTKLSLLAWLAALAARAHAAPDPRGVDFFEAKVRPILVNRCYKCHSAGAEKLKAGLRLDTSQGIFKGGESGAPPVVPGKPDDSLLISAIHYEEGGLQMPPKGKLADQQIADIEAWVKMGAPYPTESVAAGATTAPTSHPVAMTLAEGRKFWSFAPPREPPVPDVTKLEWSHNSIDLFILAKLNEAALSPSSRADKRTLIRRATFDLIGLPPSAKEIDDFVNDASPDAFEKLIDRLLASPHYGERWGRYWLDVARYADTKGYVFQEERRYGFSYTYRDWVIRALNNDLPYDQFLIQQIAADRLGLKDDKRPLAALGFLTLGRRFLNQQPDIIDDRIDVVCRGTMALTVGCARCHDHKYDPIPTADYYSLYGVFASGQEPAELPLLGETVPAPQAADFAKEKAKREADIQAYRARRRDEIIAASLKPETFAAHLSIAAQFLDVDATEFAKQAGQAHLHPVIAAHWHDYLKSAKTQFNPIFGLLSAPSRPGPDDPLVQLILKSESSPTNIPVEKADSLLDGNDVNELARLRQLVDELIATHPGSPPRAMAMEDLPQPVEPHILMRGNPASAGAQVPRQFPAILSSDDRKPFTQGSGRLELAKAIASKENPLTARVIVNRVWQYHFGNGLVRTPSDFGTRGERPTHPELLDWLTLRFVNDDGWSLKKLHKRVMLSSAYQQASVDSNAQACAKDPENRLLWRQNPRRLDFEAMRDSLLAASGQIDLTIGGRSVDILVEPFSTRRSVYAFIERQNLPGLFRTFDFASPDSTSAKRFTTSVPQQALYMMNSPFVIEQARKLAARPEVTSEADAAKRVATMYRDVLGREPAKNEIELGVSYVQSEEHATTGIVRAPSTWQYGFGEFDETLQRVTAFNPLPYWTGSAWQGGATLPDPATGWAMLNAAGGHPGDAKHLAIRRWTAPRDCAVAIGGQVAHASDQGDGVRARIVTSRDGQLATWTLHHKKASTRIGDISVNQGDTIDFVVDCGRGGDVTYDGFTWKITITKQAGDKPVAGDDSGGGWDSEKEFAGPRAPPMNAWEKYAQVLLESNEFAFVD